MNYIVLDLEWNQCPEGKIKENSRIPFEIIEIGAIRFQFSSHDLSDSFCSLIKPSVYPSLHHKTREVISLRSTDFENAEDFPAVARKFFSWCGEEPSFCTWGPADLTELQRNMAYYGMRLPFPFPFFYYDIQKIFSIVYEDRKTRRSLEYAVDFLKIEKEIPFHDALSDAYYTARVMERLTEDQLLSNSSIDCFRTPEKRKDEIHVTYGTYSKYISKPFSSKQQAMKDRAVTSTSCYLCGKSTPKKIRWFSAGSSNYFCLSFCESHGYLKGKIRLRQRQDGSFYAIKTQKLISPEEAYAIREKKEIHSLKRRLRKKYQ